jgi:O-antigen ligase
LFAGAAALGLLVPRATTPGTRALDRGVIAIIAVCLLQLLPLPRAILSVVAPARLQLAGLLQLTPAASWLPLSISPRDTLEAAAVAAGASLVYWSARRHLASAGLRHVCRGIAWLGLALSCVAIAQRAAGANRMYGLWAPIETGATPYGPFVNRNHAATWLLMAIPLSLGYLLARLRQSDAPRHARVSAASIDSRTVWLLVSASAMVLALALSLSRSGILALPLALALTLAGARRRFDSVKRRWLAAAAVVGALAVATFADVGAVVMRFSEAVTPGSTGRLAIWRDTMRLVADGWLTGSGAGTYELAMRAYQTGERTYYYNQAHNHYLQVAAEGGLLLIVPVLVSLVALAALARRRLHADRSGVFWIRSGAAAGLAGVAVQSMWETGLALPANALLAAVSAAILTHEPPAPRRDAPDTRGPAWR